MATTEVKFYVNQITSSRLFLAPLPGQSAADFGLPISEVRLTFGLSDPATIGFALNQEFLVTIQKL